MIPTIRAAQSEIWVCFNPKDADDATYQRFVVNTPANSKVVKINYTENPFCPDVMIAEANDLKEKNIGLYNHIWLGECRQVDDMRMGRDNFRLPMVEVDEFNFRGRSRDSMGRFK